MILCFVNYTARTKSYTYEHTLSLHDALPISTLCNSKISINAIYCYINATLPESPTKKAPRVRSRWGALCNERERARRPGIAHSYRALTSSGSYPGWPCKLGLQARCLGAERGLGICFCLVGNAKLNRNNAT